MHLEASFMSTATFPLEPDGPTFDAITSECVAFVRDHLMTLASQPSEDLDEAEALCTSFGEPVPEHGQPLGEILARLGPAIAKSVNTAGPGFLGYVPGGGVYAAALGDYIALSVNRFVGVRQTAPVLAAIEASVIGWLAAMMGYPKGALGILTSGGAMANFSAVVTARAAKLGDELHRGTLYASEEAHLPSIAKGASLAGIPKENVRVLPTDPECRIEPERLRRAVAEDRARGLLPFMVVVTVGTSSTGAVDPIGEVLEIARTESTWVHADAAYGGFFRLVPEAATRMTGIEACDSITLNPHKGLFMPFGTGCLLVREGGWLRHAHRYGEPVEYERDLDACDFADLSPELTREFRGLRLWLPLQMYGIDAFREQLAEKLALAQLAHAELARIGSLETLEGPGLSIVAFRLRVARGDGNRENVELLRRINARRRVFLTGAMVHGRYLLRICVLQFRTHVEHVRTAIDVIRDEAERYARESLAEST